ncbi:DUF6095 family protein [Aureibaculum sp. 2210JD6-5]|uniref:DUF6095 family protein n=1 Tax=Aureibaculum sp. 2210JD6-5 TaxID=3103957 RepID=UPI002AADEAE3|nr:DUF6095 family protein [Aureibaculum sp. 2210JD6-5]MDY7393753.1 DUF6095 family protein [Aureibaculum sp. 2210JD6-5]
MKNSKPTLFGALKYLGIALPLLFFAPILITIGFKALKKDGSYLFLILGIALGITAILTTAFGLIKVSRFIFDRDKKNGKS